MKKIKKKPLKNLCSSPFSPVSDVSTRGTLLYDMEIMETCANPGCDQPGTNKCSACKAICYCGPTCQTADWAHHKEECPGHLRKVGMANLERAERFERANNWQQTFHHANLAATKLKQIKDRPVEIISQALGYKFDALNMIGRHREAQECAKEWYCLWLTKHTHPPVIIAVFALIESCIHNNEFADAVLYAHTTWETLTLSRDSHIPEHQQKSFIAQGASLFAKATLTLAESGGMPAEEQQEAGRETITLARKALEIHTQLCGGESKVAGDMVLLASVLDYFNDVDDDEVPRLYEQAKSIYARVQGSLSPNVAAVEKNLGVLYYNSARRAAHDLDRCVANLERALPRHREAARIFRLINHVDMADQAARDVVKVEDFLREITIKRAAKTRA